MLLAEFKDKLNKILKPEIAYEWDNVGLTMGDLDKEIQTILLTLEITEKVVEEAIEKKADIIICHHPLIFNPISSITTENYKGRQIIKLIKNNIGVYVSHTNYDIMEEGLNYFLGKKLSLKEIKPLIPINDMEKQIGITGLLDISMDLDEFAKFLCQRLNIADLRLIRGNDKKIKKIGIVTGSGMDYLDYSVKENCDVFVTGDIKYHQAQDAISDCLNVIDAGHYGSEQIFAESMELVLKKYFKDEFQYIKSSRLTDPFVTITG